MGELRICFVAHLLGRLRFALALLNCSVTLSSSFAVALCLLYKNSKAVVIFFGTFNGSLCLRDQRIGLCTLRLYVCAVDAHEQLALLPRRLFLP